MPLCWKPIFSKCVWADVCGIAMQKLLYKKSAIYPIVSANCTEDKWPCPRPTCKHCFLLANTFPNLNITWAWTFSYCKHCFLLANNYCSGIDSWNSFKDGFVCWEKVIFLSCFVDLFIQYGRSISGISKYHFRIVITNSWPMNDDGFKHCRPIKTL